ncbi:hypothetical protein CHARACLAT_012215 [Characodon lateralis]|uniref:Uncharacterized protein n=1 Tax=Characodon lateralis TaxID=208331 RepID=A0ABU7F5L0_9TELE|nr:hypothetical protein [Characodon lateralis]
MSVQLLRPPRFSSSLISATERPHRPSVPGGVQPAGEVWATFPVSSKYTSGGSPSRCERSPTAHPQRAGTKIVTSIKLTSYNEVKANSVGEPALAAHEFGEKERHLV